MKRATKVKDPFLKRLGIAIRNGKEFTFTMIIFYNNDLTGVNRLLFFMFFRFLILVLHLISFINNVPLFLIVLVILVSIFGL